MSHRLIAIAVVWAAVLVGCNSEEGATTPTVISGDSSTSASDSSNTVATEANLASIQATIFDISCATSGCHAGSTPAAGLLLDSDGAITSLVDQPSAGVPSLNLVSPGDADNSYLVQKLEGSAAVGGRMPVGGSISTAQITAVRDWIDAGALVPTLESIQSNIFDARCVVCHAGSSPSAGLNLDDVALNATLVSIARPSNQGIEILVVAGDADSSFLVDKLEGNNLGGSRGARMPRSGAYLDQVTIDVVRSWIDAGAQ